MAENNNSVIEYLKKNKNFFIKNPNLLNVLNFPSKWKSEEKIIDFNAHQSIKLKNDMIKLKKNIINVLKFSKDNEIAQKKIFKACIKIINTKNIENYFQIIINDCNEILECDSINIFCNSKKYEKNKVNFINEIQINKIFNNNRLYVANNLKYISFFFPGKNKIIKSFISLKVQINKNEFFIISMGSQNKEKFPQDSAYDLILFLIKVCESKIKFLL